MSIQTAEKYISIEYSKWESFYKPLEKRYHDLQLELERERENKKLTVYLDSHTAHIKTSWFRSREIGVIDLSAGFSQMQLDRIGHKIIIRDILDQIKQQNRDIKFVSFDELTSTIKQLEERTKRLVEAKKELTEKIKSVPWFLRPFFKSQPEPKKMNCI